VLGGEGGSKEKGGVGLLKEREPSAPGWGNDRLLWREGKFMERGGLGLSVEGIPLDLGKKVGGNHIETSGYWVRG